ncbi:MAG: DUF2156 domain-containing protein [Desulfamplus sp.]|nr:DUF2156 domain-containing protein [Desulfamplus sp.]MBF0390508.1 DUF2156 domain-containing protein [Desulfamplus sp.]
MLPVYPQTVEIHIGFRELLHPMFQKLPDGISEFTFANLYLFRDPHKYKIGKIDSKSELESFIITGCDRVSPYLSESFFMLPFSIPQKPLLDALFKEHITLKCVSEAQADIFMSIGGYEVFEDRNNFDYLYKRENLAELPGRHYHKKRNLIKAFVNNHNYEGRPLLEEYIPDALKILDKWRENRLINGDEEGDYTAAKEALEKSEELQLCGGIYYVEDEPVAYSLGEELARGKSFVIHFEKAVSGYKGLWQFVNQAFASIVTEHYETINREQDLGDEGLRHAKLSYHPTGFVKKYKIQKIDSNE